MSLMKRLIEEILEMYSQGVPVDSISEICSVPLEAVENILAEYDNFCN
jgi:hypothetical protein